MTERGPRTALRAVEVGVAESPGGEEDGGVDGLGAAVEDARAEAEGRHVAPANARLTHCEPGARRRHNAWRLRRERQLVARENGDAVN